MTLIEVILSYFKTNRLINSDRATVLEFREQRLRQTLANAFRKSKFYRDLWQQQGIKETDIATVPLDRLPVVNKKMLMNNFEQVVTKDGVTKQGVEKFIAQDPFGSTLFQNKYVALNTSGSSGFIGFFLFEESFVAKLIGSVMARLNLSLLKLASRKTRIAFVGEASGHHAGFNLIQSLPQFLFSSLSVDVDLSKERFSAALNSFKPHMLTGYPSGLQKIAEAQNEGLLNIHPETVICSGEPLTEVCKEAIKQAFGFYPSDFYAASECLALGMDARGEGALEIFDGLMYLEVLDANDKPVPPGSLGRVVITVFGNSIQPLIRYALDDEITIQPEGKFTTSPFTRAMPVTGRKLDCLTFKLPGGVFQLHPMELVGLFFPGLRQYQVIQTGPRNVTFKVVADGSKEQIAKQVMSLVPEFLQNLGLTPAAVDIKVDVVDDIPSDPKTGKTPIIKVEKF